MAEWPTARVPEANGAAKRHEDPLAPVPYARHWIRGDDRRAVARVLASSHLTQGPEVARFEAELAREAGTAHAVAVSSGTAALHAALLALGVGPGDEVIVPSLTFVATANAVALCGARARFADVEPDTLTLDPEEVSRLAGPSTRGAIAVHYAGHPADTDALRSALGPHRFLLEDACHALGARWRERPAGSLGRAGCFSFHPAKAITTGEGGAVTTDDEELAAALRRAREHGIERSRERFRGLGLPPECAAEERGDWVYELHGLAPNYRLPDFAAALGRSQLRSLDAFNTRRRELARLYRSALSDLAGLRLPAERSEARSAWHLYPVRVAPGAVRGGRAALFAALRERGIGVHVHYVPVHLQPFWRQRAGSRWGDLPRTEAAYLELLSLPLFPGMSDTDRRRVVQVVREEWRRLAR